MSEYFYMLLLTSVCGAVCAVIAHGGYEKYIKYIASLICVVIMISPFRNMDISAFSPMKPDFPEAELTSRGDIYKMTADLTSDAAEGYISQTVFDKFGIKPSHVNIEIEWNGDDPVIESISLALDDRYMENAESIKEYLYDILGGEVEIIEG